MAKRLLWTQGEVVKMGKLLRLKNFDRRSIRYWQEQKVFPEPVASVEGVISFYEDEYIDVGFMDIGRRMRVPIKITIEDIKWAKEKVLEDVRSKNVSMLIKKMREKERKEI